MSVVLDYSNGVFAAKPTGGSLGTDPANIGDTNFADVSLLLHGDGTSGSTTITDSSSNAVVVTANGNAQIDTAVKKFGTGSIQFDGDNDYLSAGTSLGNFGTGDFTIEMWIYPISYNRGLFSKTTSTSGSSPPSISAYMTSTALLVGVNSGSATGSWNTCSALPALNQWSHLAICRSGTDLRCFLNGTSILNVTNNADVDNSLTLRIGYWRLNAVFEGYMDDIRFSGAARYTSNFTAPTAAFLDTGPTLDLSSGNTFVHAPSANVAYEFANPPASGTAIDFTLKVTPSATVTITWPSSVKWAGGTAPSAPASGETDAFTFYSTDGGTSYYGFQAGDAYS
jgi:hypothetical protein